MRVKRPAIASILLAAMIAAPSLAEDAGPTGEQIVARYVATQEVDSEIAYVELSISQPGSATRKHRFLTVYRKRSDGTRSYLLRMVAPKDVAGVSVLAHEDRSGAVEQYVYVPVAGKTRRLEGDARAAALLGSNFSFEDLLREIPSAHAYERRKDTELRSRAAFVVRAVEKPGGKSAYAFRELLIAKDNFELMRVDFYGKSSGKLIKTLTAYDYRSSEVKGDTRRPRRAVMRESGKEAWSDFTLIEGRLGEKVPDDIFTPQRIESWTDAEVEEFIFRFGITVKVD